MSAEGKPPAELSPLTQPFAYLTRLVLRFPVATTVLAVAAALAALGLSATRLGYRTSRLDLISANSSYNRLWLDYIEEFGSEDDVIVVVEGADRQQVIPALEEIAAGLARQERLFHAVLHKVDLDKLRSKGLYYLPPAQLQGIEGFVGQVEPIVHGQWARLSVGNLAGGLCYRMAAVSSPQGPGQAEAQAQAIRTATEADVARLADGLAAALDQQGRYLSPFPEMSIAPTEMPLTSTGLDSGYFLTKEGRLGFVLLRITKDDKDNFVQGSAAIDRLREIAARTQSKNPGTKIGVTGLPVMENDEMRESQDSMMKSNVLSMVGVAFLFVAGFGGLRHPLIGCTSLMLAMAWSLGYTTLTVGHLNIISVAFAAMLIGLGDDFSIHYVARYLQLRGTRRSVDDALIETAAGVGPGTLTGAMTTAVAFFMAGLTDFTGVAELGIIAGGGILLCCLAAMTVLPAMVHISDVKWPARALPVPLDVSGWLTPLMRRPRLVLAVTLAGTAVMAVGINRLWYDHNLLNLQADGNESVALERKVLHESERSVWYALSIAENRDELRQRAQRFRDLPSVDRVEEIASAVPDDLPQKRPIIVRIAQQLQELPEQPPLVATDTPASLHQSLAQLQGLLAGNPQMAPVVGRLAAVRQALASLPEVESYRRLAEYQQRVAADLLARLHALRAVASDQPPALSDLPAGLVSRFVGRNGRLLLRIYSKADIWDMDAMEKFVADVRRVDPRATGNPLQTYEASRQMKRSYEQAGWYALVGILIVIYLDFRSAGYTVLSMLPLGLGMLQMFGLLGLLDIPLNPANMISVPLILGIGVENGVHVLHDFHCQKGRYRMSASTAFAVVLTTLTTMVGFASLMIASHRGLQSLGRVLTIGMSCCLFSSLVILPAFLAWITWNRRPTDTTAPGEDGRPSAEKIASQRIHRRDMSHDPTMIPHVLPAPTPAGPL